MFRRNKLLNVLSKQSDAPPPNTSIFWTLWNANEETATKALNTGFIQGIKQGNLDPVKYGTSTVNDAYYCFRGAPDYQKAAERAEDLDLKEYLNQKYKSYAEYNESFKNQWHLKDASSVEPIKITKEYADHESNVVSNDDPIYALIVMMPCEYLWGWIGMKLKNDPNSAKDNIYQFWIDDNASVTSAYKMANFLDNYMAFQPGVVCEQKAMEMYSKSMEYEYRGFEAFS